MSILLEIELNETLNDFWFNIDDYNSFKSQFDKLKLLDLNSRELISKNLKEKYLKSFFVESISREYIKLIEKIIQ
jgi:glycosyltransferase involved in cell wall biosynthesis